MDIELTDDERLSLIVALQAIGSGKSIHEVEMILNQGGILRLHRRTALPYTPTEFSDNDTFDLKFCD